MVNPSYRNQRGHPVLIARAMFDELMQIGRDEGANTVMRGHRDETRFVKVADPGILLDVDDPDTFLHLQS
jgi:molybdenum cofactor cytidylyltransferase